MLKSEKLVKRVDFIVHSDFGGWMVQTVHRCTGGFGPLVETGQAIDKSFLFFHFL